MTTTTATVTSTTMPSRSTRRLAAGAMAGAAVLAIAGFTALGYIAWCLWLILLAAILWRDRAAAPATSA